MPWSLCSWPWLQGPGLFFWFERKGPSCSRCSPCPTPCRYKETWSRFLPLVRRLEVLVKPVLSRQATFRVAPRLCDIYYTPSCAEAPHRATAHLGPCFYIHNPMGRTLLLWFPTIHLKFTRFLTVKNTKCKNTPSYPIKNPSIRTLPPRRGAVSTLQIYGELTNWPSLAAIFFVKWEFKKARR